MEEKTPSMTKSAMTYGLYLGIALIVYSLILYVSGLFGNKQLGYVSYAIILVGLGWGIKHFRDNVNGGFLAYGQGVGLGVLIAIAGGFVSSIFSFILLKYIDPELIEQLIRMGQEEALKSGATQEQIEMSDGIMRKFMSPGIMTIIGIVGSGIIGAIFSLILAAIFKKEKPLFDGASE